MCNSVLDHNGRWLRHDRYYAFARHLSFFIYHYFYWFTWENDIVVRQCQPSFKERECDIMLQSLSMKYWDVIIIEFLQVDNFSSFFLNWEKIRNSFGPPNGGGQIHSSVSNLCSAQSCCTSPHYKQVRGKTSEVRWRKGQRDKFVIKRIESPHIAFPLYSNNALMLC